MVLHYDLMCAIMKIGKAILKGVTDMNKISINQAILDELVEGILTIMHDELVAIILYGSVARGSATAESDVDIALIMKNPLTKECEERLNDLIVDLDLKYDKVFSVIDIESGMLQKWMNAVPFYQNLEREGITLWKAA